MERPNVLTKRTRRQQIVHEFRVVLTSLFHSPAAWTFGAAWLLSFTYLLLAGYGGDVLPSLALVLLIAVLSLLTLLLTRDAQTTATPTRTNAVAEDEATTSQARVWVQLVVVLLVVLFTGYRGMLLNGAISVASGSLPVVTPLVVFLARFPLDVVNPLLYVVLPMALFLLAGVSRRDLGFARGYRTWAVTLLWCTPLLVVIIISLLGGTQLSTLGLKLLHNSLRNGFFEEFLFRGALMAALIRLLDQHWGIVLSSLLFGLWHLGTNTASFGGNFLPGVAFGVVDQAVIGLGFAQVVYRTRNLLASSIIHVFLNTAFG